MTTEEAGAGEETVVSDDENGEGNVAASSRGERESRPDSNDTDRSDAQTDRRKNQSVEASAQ